MTLNFLSESSIVRIFKQLTLRDSANLIKTAFRYKNISRTNETLCRREAFELRLIIDYRDPEEPDDYDSVIVAVMWNRPRVNTEDLLREMNSSLYFYWNGRKSNYYYLNEKTVAIRKTREELEQMICERIEDTLRKISNIRILTVHGFKISKDLIGKLKNVVRRPLEALIVCDSRSSKEADLTSLLDALKPANVFLNNYSREVYLNDMHLANIPKRLRFANSRDYNGYYEDIGDQTMINWIYKTPQDIDLGKSRTQITLGGVIKFIETIMNKFSTDEDIGERKSNFFIGIVRSDRASELNFFHLQRVRGFDIQIYADWYKINFKHIEIVFVVNPSVRRITKQQARTKIQDIARQVAEKRVADPDFSWWDDDHILPQMMAISDQLYDDWLELENELELAGSRGYVPDEDSEDEVGEQDNSDLDDESEDERE